MQLLETDRGLLDASIPRVVTALFGRAGGDAHPAARQLDGRIGADRASRPFRDFLGKLDTEGERATRLDLANWLVSRDNPLTARAFVNRLWREFFGTGLSKVLDDLGSQGEWPTHPELLDWLAAEFMQPEFDAATAHDWDMKHMIRPIVTSQTYRQSSLAESRQGRQGSGQSPARAAEPLPRGCRDGARCDLARLGPAEREVRRPQRQPDRAGRLSRGAELSRSASTRPATATTSTGAASTRSGSARSCIPAC